MNVQASGSAAIRTLKSEELNHRVEQDDHPFLIYFSAPWCGPCKQVAPILEELASEQPSERVVKVNIDDSTELAAQFNVRQIPTVIVIAAGEEQARVVGAKPRSVYAGLLTASDADQLDEVVNPKIPDISDALRAPELLAKVLHQDPGFIARRDELTELTPLEMAVRNCMDEAAEILLDAGAKPGPVEAMAISSIDAIEDWIRKTPEITAPDRVRGTTALHTAAGWGRAEVVKLLLDAGADPSVYEVAAPLFDAVMSGSVDAVRTLLEAGASANPEPGDKADEPYLTLTPLHLAAASGNREICELLVQQGADLRKVRDQFGPQDEGTRTPAGDAETQGHADLAGYLRSCCR